jgi:hypothetical protein
MVSHVLKLWGTKGNGKMVGFPTISRLCAPYYCLLSACFTDWFDWEDAADVCGANPPITVL